MKHDVQTGSFKLGYRPALDGVRAVAILAVLGYHYHDAAPFQGGFLGVEIFFVLSGFLITTILLQEHARRGAVSLRNFYVRRARRLLPALFLVVAAIALYVSIDRPAGLVSPNLHESVAALFYVDNWYQALARPPQTMIGHSWSLSIEEQFYLLWPLALLLALRRGWQAAMTVAIAGAVAGAAIRGIEFGAGMSPRYTYSALEGRADALLLGCVLALLAVRGVLDGESARRWGRRAAVPALVVFVVLLGGARVTSGWLYAGGFTVFAVATVVLLANVVMWRGPMNRALEWAPAVLLGRISYGVYLWHQPIYIASREHVASNAVAIAVALPLTLAVAVASYRFVEQPILRRARRRGDSLPTVSAVPQPASA